MPSPSGTQTRPGVPPYRLVETEARVIASRSPRKTVWALGYGSDWARMRRSIASAGHDQSMALSASERLWK